MLGDKSRVDARYCMPLTLRKADLWEAKKMTFKNAEVMIFVEIMLASTMNAVFVAFFALLTSTFQEPCRTPRRGSCSSSPTRGSSNADRVFGNHRVQPTQTACAH